MNHLNHETMADVYIQINMPIMNTAQ